MKRKIISIKFLDKVKKYHWYIIIFSQLLSVVTIFFVSNDLNTVWAYTIPIVLISIAFKYVIYFVLWFQLINPLCPRIVLKSICWLFVICLCFALLFELVISILIIVNIQVLPDYQDFPFSRIGILISAISGALLFYRKILLLEQIENYNVNTEDSYLSHNCFNALK